MVVYLATNQLNGMQYVGQTVDSLPQRWKEHISEAKSGTTYHFHRAIRKYGADSFSLCILHECETKEEMDFVEIFYIDILVTKSPVGYNLTHGGDGTLGYKHTEEAKRKQSETHRGKKRTKESIRKTADAHRGTKHSEETKKKMSEAAKGRKFSEVTLLKMSLAKLGTKQTPETIAKRVKALMGRKVTAETRAKIGTAARRRFEYGRQHAIAATSGV